MNRQAWIPMLSAGGAFAVIAACWVQPVLAQAGGGGGYGGASGGGGGGGSGGDSDLLFWLIYLAFRHPQIGIPVLIVAGVIFYFSQQAEKDYRITRTIRRGRKLQEQSLRDQALAAIRQRDPEFDESIFLQRAAAAFGTTQYAWSEQRLASCRAFISDGVHERFGLYIAMQRAENIRNRMRDVVVTHQNIVAITSDRHFDTIHVRFVASAISYNEDLDSGRRVSGNSDRSPISFAEIWSFSRRPGVRTNPERSLLEGTCPNCGGPVEIVDQAQCPQCDSIVNSGQYDWVLAEITQDEEWVVPPARHLVPGWEQLAEHDPGLNEQHLEDRASVIFWRCLLAVYFDDLNYARPVLDAQQQQLPPRWDLPPGRFWKTPAVGVVEVRRGESAAADDPFDRIQVLVRWSATQAEGDRRRPQLLNQQRIYSHVMLLKRRKGVTSNVDRAFSSFSCPNCGGPIEVGQSAECGFCHTTLNDGSHAWVLEEVRPFDAMADYPRESLGGRGADRLERERFLNEPELLAALVRMVAADGELHPQEEKYLTDLARRRGVSQQRLQTIVRTAVADEQPLPLPADRQQANAFMDHLIRAALVDGRITNQERKILTRVGAQLEWAPADLNVAINRNRGELYQQAKQILRKKD